MQEIFKPLVKFWCSLRLTVVCLLAALVLVFVGTLAQVDQGLYNAQKNIFAATYLFLKPLAEQAGLKYDLVILIGTTYQTTGMKSREANSACSTSRL